MEYELISIPVIWPEMPIEKITLKGFALKEGVELSLGINFEDEGIWAPKIVFLSGDPSGDDDTSFVLDQCINALELPGNYAIPLSALYDGFNIEKCVVQILTNELEDLELEYLAGTGVPYDHIEVGLHTVGKWFTGKVYLHTKSAQETYSKLIEIPEET